MIKLLTWYIITWNDVKGRDSLMKVPNFLLAVIIVSVLLLTACQKEDIEADIYNFLEKTATHEGTLGEVREQIDRKSTRLNSSHVANSYAVFCFKNTKQTSTRLKH